MSTEQVFLDAIRANPDDDVMKLVYADWLDEQGDVRGELIRVSLARQKFWDQNDCNRDELKRWARTLGLTEGFIVEIPPGLNQVSRKSRESRYDLQSPEIGPDGFSSGPEEIRLRGDWSEGQVKAGFDRLAHDSRQIYEDQRRPKLMQSTRLLKSDGNAPLTPESIEAANALMLFLDEVLVPLHLWIQHSKSGLCGLRLPRNYYIEMCGSDGAERLCVPEQVESEEDQFKLFTRDVATGFLEELCGVLEPAESEIAQWTYGLSVGPRYVQAPHNG